MLFKGGGAFKIRCRPGEISRTAESRRREERQASKLDKQEIPRGRSLSLDDDHDDRGDDDDDDDDDGDDDDDDDDPRSS